MLGQPGEWPLSRILAAVLAAVFLFASSRVRSTQRAPVDAPRARLARQRLFWLVAAFFAAFASTAFARQPVAKWTLFGLTVLALLGALKVSFDLKRLPPDKSDAGQGGGAP